jgi:hypothetical protein
VVTQGADDGSGIAGAADAGATTKARPAARRTSANPVGRPGRRQESTSVPGATSDEARVQSRRRVRRLEMAAPDTTGRAAQVRPEVSRIQAEVGSAIRKDDQ